MPIFSRRRLQVMLDDLRLLPIDEKKANDLLGRLNDKRSEQVLGAEMELALLWGIKQVADIEIEPTLTNSKRKLEAYTKELFGTPSYIEITTLSDGNLSGEKKMQRAARKITDFSNSVKKGTGNFLYYTFQEISFWKEDKFFRQQHITSSFELDNDQKNQLKAWIPTCKAQDRLHLQNDKIDVTVEVKSYKQKEGFNFFCSLPPLAYDIKGNPLFKQLKKKQKQLSGVPEDSYKVIFLTDGGNDLLRNLTNKDHLQLYKSGQEIINRFMANSSIDLIFVFSPKQDSHPFHPALNKLIWQVSLFSKDKKEVPLEKLKEFLALIPAPRFKGYQARSLWKQEAFAPLSRGWYLGNKITTGKILTMKISARALQEFLAGAITKDQFEYTTLREENYFKFWLMQGYTISDVKFESAGIDEDDDYIVFSFDKNPSASPLK